MKEARNGFLKPLSQLKKKYDTVFQANQIDRLSQKIDKLEFIIVKLTQKLDQKIGSGSFKKQYEQTQQSPNSSQNQHEDVEPRFTQLKFNIEKTIGWQENQRIQHLKIFSAELARKILSKSFIWYQQGKFTDQKFRQFFCNNFLSNIVRYAITNKLSQKQLKQLDQHLKKKVLGFLKQKYPQNQSSSANRKFQTMITPVDNFQSNANDLVHKSGVKFRRKKNGDYSKQIMLFINYVLGLTRQQQQDGRTLFQHFVQDMENIFKNVQNQEWVLKALKGQFNQQDTQSLKLLQVVLDDTNRTLYQQSRKQQYRKNVKQYTKYAVGQKIPDNVSFFTQQQIQQQNLLVNSPQVMRIMTKWAEQLQKCFDQVSIYLRDQRFRMQDGSERYVKKKTREELYIQIREQQKRLQQFIKQVKNNIYENQHEIFKDKRCISSFKNFASQDEQISGYFATVMKKSYQNYLISYLNEIIHRILSAQEELKQKYNKKQYYKIATSLISFKLSDLLRCKCSSKQVQIISLYQYLKYYCAKFPQKLELVRVKNRLTEGTKDILINFMYKKTMLVQMQLSINQETSTFIKCSDKANHFIYQLQRATFGPISQICKVYSSVDPRAEYFRKQFQVINMKSIQNPIIPMCKHRLKESLLPIWCSQCNKFISRPNLITKHRKCQICQYSKCSFCLIRNGQIQNIKVQRKKIKFNQLNKPSPDLIRKKITILNLDKKNFDYSIVYIVYFNFKLMFFQEVELNNSHMFLGQAKNEAEFNKFFNQKQIIKQQENIKQQESLLMSIHHQIVRLMIKNVNKKLRKYFVFQQLKIDQSVFENKKMETVQIINMNNVSIKSISHIISAFPNAKHVLINKNKIQNLKDIQNWKKVVELNLEGNRLDKVPIQMKKLANLSFLLLTNNKFTSFPDQLCQVTSLQTLNFKQNQIIKISPKIGQLKNLKRLRLNSNNIQHIPEEIIMLKQLIEIDFSSNNIKKLPDELKKMTSIQLVIFANNCLTSIDDDTFDILNQVTKVDFSENKIQKIPDSLKQKPKLFFVDFQNNKIKKIPAFIFKLPKLQQLQLNNNQISEIQINQIPSEPKLKILSLVKNKLTQIPNKIFQMKTIQKLKLGRNQLKQIPFQILKLRNLKQINFQGFNLKQFPQIILKMNKLEKIDLDFNEISSVPAEIKKFDETLRQFQLNNNKFTVFPKQVVYLTSLQYLGLNNNMISQFPPDVIHLQSLQKIKLQQMNIKTLPFQFSKLGHLRQLCITYDKLQDKQSLKNIAQANQKIKNQMTKIQKAKKNK